MYLKSVSLHELENAIASSMRDLLGEKYDVRIERLDFDSGDARTADMTVRIDEENISVANLLRILGTSMMVRIMLKTPEIL